MFTGFSERTIDFLWNVRFHNDRQWLAENKQAYREELLLPLQELAKEVYEKMREKFPEEGLSCHISRIYRDARRCHGQPPLKEELWFSLFAGAYRDTARPEFYFSVAPEGYYIGMGFWSARPADMARFRQNLLQSPQTFSKQAKAFAEQKEFVLRGEDYVRYTGEPSELLKPWFTKKRLYLQAGYDYDARCFSQELVPALLEAFTFLMPYYRYFMHLCCQGEPHEKL